MASKPKKRSIGPAPKSYKSSDFAIQCRKDDDFGVAVAKNLTRPEVGAAAVIEQWQRDTHNINALAAELGRQVEAVNRGDLSRPEGMLISQAHSLNEIFVNLARRSMKQEYLKQWEAYMRMAMKAQNQCRMTLETLSTVKNPQVVYARQANINNGGQQQVNNAPAPDGGARPSNAPARDSQSEKTELLECTNGERMVPGATSKTSSADPVVATVGAIDRATNDGGQG